MQEATGLAGELAVLHTELATLQTTSSTATSYAEQARIALVEAQVATSAADERAACLQAELKDRDSQLASLRHELADAQAAAETVAADAQQAYTELASKEAELADLQTLLSKKEEDLQQAQSQLDQVQAALCSAKAASLAADQDAQSTNDELASVRAMVDMLTATSEEVARQAEDAERRSDAAEALAANGAACLEAQVAGWEAQRAAQRDAEHDLRRMLDNMQASSEASARDGDEVQPQSRHDSGQLRAHQAANAKALVELDGGQGKTDISDEAVSAADGVLQARLEAAKMEATKNAECARRLQVVPSQLTCWEKLTQVCSCCPILWLTCNCMQEQLCRLEEDRAMQAQRMGAQHEALAAAASAAYAQV